MYKDVKHGLYLQKLMMTQTTAITSEYKSSIAPKYLS